MFDYWRGQGNQDRTPLYNHISNCGHHPCFLRTFPSRGCSFSGSSCRFGILETHVFSISPHHWKIVIYNHQFTIKGNPCCCTHKYRRRVLQVFPPTSELFPYCALSCGEKYHVHKLIIPKKHTCTISTLTQVLYNVYIYTDIYLYNIYIYIHRFQVGAGSITTHQRTSKCKPHGQTFFGIVAS